MSKLLPQLSVTEMTAGEIRSGQCHIQRKPALRMAEAAARKGIYIPHPWAAHACQANRSNGIMILRPIRHLPFGVPVFSKPAHGYSESHRQLFRTELNSYTATDKGWQSSESALSLKTIGPA